MVLIFALTFMTLGRHLLDRWQKVTTETCLRAWECKISCGILYLLDRWYFSRIWNMLYMHKKCKFLIF